MKVTPPLADELPDETEPAIHFYDADDARDALTDWAGKRAALEDQRDALVRGALAVGISPTEVHAATNLAPRIAIARSTVLAIAPDRSAITVAGDVLASDHLRYAYLLRYRALRLMREAAEAEAPLEDGYLMAYCRATSNQARIVYRRCGNDRGAQAVAAEARRAAAAVRDEPDDGRFGRFTQGFLDALARIAREMTLLRAKGNAVLDDLFDTADIEAEATAAKAHSAAMRAWAQGPDGTPAPADPFLEFFSDEQQIGPADDDA